MFKYTTTTLEKIETLLNETGYIVRYEKGNFKSGYCILKDKRVIVINKYFNTESRINSLIDIIPILELSSSDMTEKSQALFRQIIELQPAA